MNQDYKVLLFYKYVAINDPEKLMEEQRALCQSLGLTGRIIVAKEGINGTVEGTLENTQKYMDEMNKTKEFRNMSFKISKGTGNAFPKLRVRVRPEIVTAGLSHLNPNKVTGKYISAEHLHTWFETKKEFYIVDMRNDYEYESGYFEKSEFAMMHNFYELPTILPRLMHLKNKTIVTVCTGGVRCEKASGFLVENGFADVYQLKDGIQTYMEAYPNQHFKGKLYVFDNRLTIGFNTESKEHEIIGRCYYCNKPCDNYVNCQYNFCHYHHIACEDCKDSETGFYFCKEECKEKYIKTPSISTSI